MKKFNNLIANYDPDAAEEANLQALFEAHSNEKTRREKRFKDNQDAHRNGGKKAGKKGRRNFDEDDGWN